MENQPTLENGAKFVPAALIDHLMMRHEHDAHVDGKPIVELPR